MAQRQPSKWSDHAMHIITGRVRDDTEHADPASYIGKVMRCRMTAWSTTGRTVHVRVDRVSTTLRYAWVVELDGRCKGRHTRVMVEALIAPKVTQ